MISVSCLHLINLPGCTAEDYSLHISQTVDSITDVYCKFYSVDFDGTRKIIIEHIKNTITDRATVNHATISLLRAGGQKVAKKMYSYI